MGGVAEELAGTAVDAAVERLKELLDYVGQVIKLDERPAFKLSEYRLGNGQTFLFHEHELHALPGMTHDLTDEDGPIWLCAERLKRNDPPNPSETLAPWLDLSPDPDRTPLPRDHLLKTVSKPECDELVASGQARVEDCAESLSADAKGQFDVRLRLEDRPEIAGEAEKYLSLSWLPWSVGERPRRRSIALYQKLFEAVQLSELGGAEQAIELVWGIGLSRWIKDGAVIDLPLIERLVEIEIDERSAGTIRIRPRQAQATVNLRPYEELKIEGAPVAQDAARRAIASAEDDLGVSPFQRETFEPVLRACQTRLDPEGTYLPDSQSIEPATPPPPPSPSLVVSDRWVFFARKRSDNFLLQDLANLKASIERSPNLPGPSRTLVMGPAQAPAARWKPLSDSMGVAAGGNEPEMESGPLGDLFFPKPFNSEQVEIVRRLEVNDGVVVQGPPGTGKTHTISNIICHYLAQGRRVLVVSHGEAALSVLRDHLPAEVRDLAISITTSEKEGFKQLEGAVRLLQSIVESLRPNEQLRLIADLEASIIGMRGRIREIDAEVGKLASAQLSAVPGQKVRPAELAAAVVAAGGKHEWFSDRPKVFSAVSAISDDDAASIRSARIALGARIEHLHARLPSASDLPGGRALAHLHADIVRADAFHAQAASDSSVVLRITSGEALQHAERAADALDVLVDACRHLEKFPFLRPLCVAIHSNRDAPFHSALQAFLSEAAGILAAHKKYLQTPVAVPDDMISSPELFDVISRRAAGEKVFGVFAFKQKALKPAIDTIRVLSHAPTDAAEWAHVRDYVSWRNRFLDAQLRWQGLAPELGAASIGFSTVRHLSELSAALQVMVDAPRIYSDVRSALRKITVGETSDLWPDEQRLRAMRTSLRNATSAVRLAAAREEVTRLAGLFQPDGGKVGALARSFLTGAVGRADLLETRIEETWTRLLEAVEDLARHRGNFETLLAGANDVADAGAPEWADRLRSESALDGQDIQTPADWRQAWDWAAAQRYLTDLDQRHHVAALAVERAKLDAAVSKGFEQVVRERTFYALANSMTGPVRAALMMFATALRRIGKGTGKGALRHRRDARKAMAACYDGVPCWIMPSWRVAEQLPGELGTFDLVIMDEASQSDVKEVTALLRGRKILVVGDDKQVSPTAAFIDNAKIDRLERTFLTNQPFKTLLLPGASLYDLAKVMFPDKFVMLREHFRCVEPIIKFSTQFYTEALVPLRIPTAHERIDPPLVDIYVPDGRRTGDKVNLREAEVIVEEVLRIVGSPVLARIGDGERWRSIGVISLIGSKQAALVNRMLLEVLGEETVLRHRIACGDSATFQGNERDIVFLSMVADPASKQAQTALHFEQRFNVAMSRARDRMYLVRSVREEELKPDDLKTKVLRHFRDPMKGSKRPEGDIASLCDSDFERAVLRRLLARGYRVTPQVGAMGYKIDLVVEGEGDRRLAVECDGDQYHGPERWADDMARQRVLERVGWRFWRCWASSFTIDPDGCMADLFSALDANGVQPMTEDSRPERYSERRVAEAKHADPAATNEKSAPVDSGGAPDSGIKVGDSIVVRFLDDNKNTSFVLSRDRHDPVNGLVGAETPFGKQLLGFNEEDELEVEVDGRIRRVLIVRAARERASLH